MKPIARKDDLVIQEMGGEILVYDLRNDKAICLNQTSALVWQNCDGKKDALEISKSIEKQLGTSVNENLVYFAIDQLSKERLLEKEVVTDISGLSRREVIKKIGFASMVALPVVSMLSFPKSANAQTACPTSICSETNRSGGCAAGSHCCRGTCVPNNTTCTPACG